MAFNQLIRFASGLTELMKSALKCVEAVTSYVHQWRDRTRLSGSRNRRPQFKLELLESRLLLSADLSGSVDASQALKSVAPTPQLEAITLLVDGVKGSETSRTAAFAPTSAGLSDVGGSQAMSSLGAESQQFGNMAGQGVSTNSIINDANGTAVSGPSGGEMTGSGNRVSSRMTSTTADSVPIVTTSSGAGHTTQGDLRISGSIGQITSSTADLVGPVQIDGAVDPVTLQNVQGGKIEAESLDTLQGAGRLSDLTMIVHDQTPAASGHGSEGFLGFPVEVVPLVQSVPGQGTVSPAENGGSSHPSIVGLSKAEALWGRIGSLFAPPVQYAGEVGGYGSVLDLPDRSRITTTDQWNQRRVEIRDYWLQQIGPWPASIQHPRVMIDNGTTVSPEGITRHDIELETFPGTTSRAILLTPPGNGPFPAVLDVWYFPEESAGLAPSLGGNADFAYQLAKRGFVSLAMTESSYRGDRETGLQYLSMLAYQANNAYNFLADQPLVNESHVGIVGHSLGGKWALFGGALTDNFAAVAVSDPGIVWDETRANVNYWEPWYLGYDVGAATQRSPGLPTLDNPRTGAYKRLYEAGHDLTELHALIAPRPFLVSGGSEDMVQRWEPLNRDVELNQVLGYTNRVAMTNRPGHVVDVETNQRVTDFFDYFLNT